MITIAAALGIVAGILASLSLIYQKGVKPIIHAVKRTMTVFEKVMEYDDRLTVIEHNSKQLTNNGGTHLKDAVDRIERSLSDHLLQSATNTAANQAEFLNIYKQLNGANPAAVVNVS